MAARNALSALGGPPPAPNPDPQPPTPGLNALAGPQVNPQAGPQTGAPLPPPPPPVPTHQQTVAAVRHFDAIEQEITTLLKDPDCGKADIRSKAIDGMMKLVAKNIVTPAEAVTQLSQFPDDPFEQKQALENHLKQTVVAATMILHNHAVGAQQAAASGQPMDDTPYNPDEHQNIIAGLHGRYKGARGNA